MRVRWVVQMLAVDGDLIHQQPFSLKRRALKFAKTMRSPLYDVVLFHPDGSKETLSAHTPPMVMLEQLRRAGS